MSQISQLFLTDGTSRIDLMRANRQSYGFALNDYIPGRAQPKEGGQWSDSPMAPGRQLVGLVPGNLIDTLTLQMHYSSQREIINAFEEFDLMIDKAHSYWLSRHDEAPVWIQARAQGESNPRYAVVHFASYDENFDPYHQPYAGGDKVSTEEFTLLLEHGFWLEYPPGTGETITTLNDLSVIGVAENFVGNMHNNGLTHIYVFTGSFGSNLLTLNPPYTLLGATMAVGNILYLGADEPFFSVKFNRSVLAGAATIAWEYWNGAAWTTVLPEFPQFTFQTASPEYVMFQSGSFGNWAKTTVNGQNKYWLRARVSAVTNNTSPVQSTYHVFAGTENYIEIGADQVDGTEDALLSVQMKVDTTGTLSELRTLMALRDYDRGPEFQAWLNYGSGNPSGITTTAGSGAMITENSADGEAPGSKSVAVTYTNDQWISVAYFNIAQPALDNYFGRFRLLLMYNMFGGGTIPSYVRYLLGATDTSADRMIQGEVKSLLITTGDRSVICEMGYIDLPPAPALLSSDNVSSYTIALQAYVQNGQTLEIMSICLLPADEWIADLSGGYSGTYGNNPAIQVIDAISYPKYPKRSLYKLSNGTVLGALVPDASGVPLLRVQARQRLWFVVGPNANGTLTAPPSAVSYVQIAKSQRYKHLRGD